MIRNIFNWVGGGFFRTIGRFVAFIVLGAIAYILIGKSNIKITDLLGIETIHATTTDYVLQYNSKQGNVSSDVTGNIQSNFYTYTGSFTLRQHGELWYEGRNATNGSYTRVYEKLGFCMDNGSEFLRAWKNSSLNNSTDFVFTVNNTNQKCYYQNGGTYQGHLSYLYIAHTVGTSGCDSNLNVCYMDIDNYFGVQVYPSDKSYSIRLLTQQYGYGVQDFDNNDILFQQFIQQQQATTSAIESQSQQQAQQHNETMSYIQDTNMTETNTTATSFFDNFTDTDHGGLSSIITAPLSTINNMLSNTCVAPSATWKGATITLPCGDLLWSRPGADGLRNLLNVFYGGFICYYAIRRLFFLIENLKDPTKDNLEVTDL